MRYLIVFLTIISTINLFAEDYKLWEKNLMTNIDDVDFAGTSDEFILINMKRGIYKFNALSSDLIDSMNYEHPIADMTVGSSGKEYFVATDGHIIKRDVYTHEIIEIYPAIELSETAPPDVSIDLQDLFLSSDGKLITYRYNERRPNDYKHFEFVIYDLENKRVIAREGDESRGYQSMFYNPTFTPDGEMLLVLVDRPSTDFNEEERQVWFYDISEQKFITIGEKDQFKNKVQTNSGNNSDFTFLNNSEVHITNSVLPDLYGFNVLNLETGMINSLYNFKTSKDNIAITKPIRMNNYLYLIGIYNVSKFQFKMTLFDIENRRVVSDFLASDVGRLNADKALDKVLIYNSFNLTLCNLSEYLKIADVKSVNLISETNVFPNPSNSRSYTLRMNLLSNINASINLYNTVGQKVLTIKENIFLHIGENIVDFNIPLELPSGQYFLRIESERGSQDVKIQL